MTADLTPERGEGLKPCPFCGGPATMTDGMGEHWVLCRPCGANGTATSKQSAAIAAWNTRLALSPAVPDEVVGVLREIIRCDDDALGGLQNGAGLLDCIDNHGRFYQSADLDGHLRRARSLVAKLEVGG